MIPYDDDPNHLTLYDLAKFLLKVIIAFVLVVAFVWGWMSLGGCAARKPHVYNDTCDLCITRPLPKKNPPRPRPQPRRPFYMRAFNQPQPDCVEIDHKLDTSIRTWACATNARRL